MIVAHRHSAAPLATAAIPSTPQSNAAMPSTPLANAAMPPPADAPSALAIRFDERPPSTAVGHGPNDPDNTRASNLRENDLPATVLGSGKKGLILRLAALMPGVRQALEDARKEEIAGAGAAVAGDAEPAASPPVRGLRSGLEPPTAMQYLQQVLSLGHYWSEPTEAPTFLFAFQGQDWITLLWHMIIFSRLYQFLSRGACPRFRRLGHSYVVWNGGARKLRGTPPTPDDEIGTIKATFILMTLMASAAAVFLCGVVLGSGAELGLSFLPPAEWFSKKLSWAALGLLYLAYSYIFMISAGLSLWPHKLVGTRPKSLPGFMSLLVRAKAPQFMISYAWGGEASMSLTGLAHGLADVLPDCWLDVRRLIPGQRLLDEVRLPAKQARVLVVLMNSAYVTSTNCGHELIAALLHRDPSTYRTVVLIEAPDDAVGHAPKWGRIAGLLKDEARFDIVRKIDAERNGGGLLEWLDRRACRHDSDHANPLATGTAPIEPQEDAATRNDAEKTMAWYKLYEFGASEAITRAQDILLPWNFYFKPNDTSFKGLMTISFFSDPFTYLKAFFHPRSRLSLTTGVGGMWLPANAAAPPRPHAALSPSIVSLLVWAYLIPTWLAIFIFAFDWTAEGLSGAALLLKVLQEAGAAVLILIFYVGPLMAYSLRWGDVLTAPASLLHSPELFVPLLVRELNLLLPPGQNITYEVKFVTPSNSHALGEKVTEGSYRSNCVPIATNLSAFLKAAGLTVDPPENIDSLSKPEGVKRSAVYVIMLETKRDLDEWIRLQGRTSLRPEQAVIVTSSRFFMEHKKEVSRWLAVTFSEAGADARLTASGTESELGLASQIINAISMRIVGMLSSRGTRERVSEASPVGGEDESTSGLRAGLVSLSSGTGLAAASTSQGTPPSSADAELAGPPHSDSSEATP